MSLVERYCTSDAAGGGDGSSGNPWTLSEAIANCAAGDRINILSGTYTRTASDTISTSGTVGSPIIFRGVSSFSPLTSAYVGRMTTGPLITTGMPVIAYNAGRRLSVSGSFQILEGLVFTGSYNGDLINTEYVSYGLIKGCSVTNAANNSSACALYWVGNGSAILSCDVYNTGTTNSTYVVRSGVQNGGNANRIIDCRMSNTSTSGAGCLTYPYGPAGIIANCVFLPSAGVGLLHGSSASMATPIIGCVFYGHTTAAILTTNGAISTALWVQNCIFSGNAYALDNPYNATAAHSLISVNNAYYNNTNANRGFGDWPEQGRIDLASDPFVNAAAGDFRLKPGSLARNAGLGGVDCGAIQHVDPTQPATTTVWFGTAYNDGLSTGEMRASDIANCEAGNIKKDVVIDDVTGIYEGTAGYTYGDDDPDQVLTTATGAGNYVPIADSDTVDGGVAYGAGEEGTGVNAATILTALGLGSGDLDTQLAAIKAETATIAADTTKVKAATYDSAPMGNDGYIVLSNGTRVLVSAAGRATTES